VGKTLYVGGDDSNHAGDSTGEFIVACFSFNRDDSIVRPWPNTRNYSLFQAWMRSPERDYRFTVRKAEQYRKSGLNLPIVLPCLISDFLETTEDVEQVNVYLDGALNGDAKHQLREECLTFPGVKHVVIDNFLKKRQLDRRSARKCIQKRPLCPRLVYMADVVANHLYFTNKGLINLINDKKLVRGNGLF